MDRYIAHKRKGAKLTWTWSWDGKVKIWLRPCYLIDRTTGELIDGWIEVKR